MMHASQLNPGDEFRVDFGGFGHADYRLIYVNQSRAYVEPLMKNKKKIVKFDDLLGDVVAEFESSSGAVNIAPSTEVTLLAVDFDDLLGPMPGNIVDNGVNIRKSRASYGGLQTHPIPTDGLRPLAPDTKRGQVVNMLAAGRTVSAVCEALGIKRSCCMSHLSDARKFCGVAYEVDGEKVRVKLP